MSELAGYQRKALRGMAHDLDPAVLVGQAGLSESVLASIVAALEAHELIKVKVNAETRDDRAAIVQALTEKGSAELIQRIGNIALLYRPAQKPSAKLSNILRYQNA